MKYARSCITRFRAVIHSGNAIRSQFKAIDADPGQVTEYYTERPKAPAQSR